MYLCANIDKITKLIKCSRTHRSKIKIIRWQETGKTYCKCFSIHTGQQQRNKKIIPCQEQCKYKGSCKSRLSQIGKITFLNVWRLEAPSTYAASSKVDGTPLIKLSIVHITKGMFYCRINNHASLHHYNPIFTNNLINRYCNTGW